MSLDLRQLRYFLTMVEAGSLTRAAAILNVAQPALSLHLRNMETHLAAPLLVRSRTGVHPTEAGEVLARRARTILDDVARTEDEIRNLEADPSGVVRIGLTGTISDIVALPLVEAVRARYPRITLNIAEAMSGFVADWLAEARVDLAVLYARSETADVRSEKLLEEELVVVRPPGRDMQSEMQLTELAGRSLILPSAMHGLRVQIDRALSEHSIVPVVEIEVDSYVNIKRLVAAGYGMSILPRHAVHIEAEQGRVSVSRIAAPGLWRGAHLMYAARRPMTRAQAVVRDLLRDVVTQLLTDGTWASARPPS